MNSEVVKLGIHIVSSLGVSKVISEVIANNTVIESTADKVLVKTGTLVLGTMIGGHAKNHVNDVIDKATNMFKSKEDKDDENNDDENKPSTDPPPAPGPGFTQH
jgi:hypothetical protein